MHRIALEKMKSIDDLVKQHEALSEKAAELQRHIDLLEFQECKKLSPNATAEIVVPAMNRRLIVRLNALTIKELV